MPSYLAAIDQGTTSTRCILFSRTGPAVCAQREHRQIMPAPGHVEHDPIEIWQATQQVIREALRQGGVAAGDIEAVGITNQRETTLVWDRRTGQPVHNAIVWQDTRTKPICDRLAAESSQDRLRRLTGLPLATYFSGPKVQWLLENVAGARQLAEQGHALFGTIDSWLIWNLTGGPRGGIHITDPTNASRTLLMNLDTLDWDDSLLELFTIPRSMLPTIVPSSLCLQSPTTVATGPFAAAIPIAGILGDQQAALVGQACFNPGDSKNTYGTGCFMLLNTGQTPVHSTAGLVSTVAYQFGTDKPVYALEGSIAVTGALVQWLRDNLKIIERSADIEALAASVPDNGGVYFVPAFSGLFAPYWRSDARGLIIGLSRHTTKAHLARAALEATAYQTRDVLDAMLHDARVPITALKVDGGMSVNNLLMQVQADILGIPVHRPRMTETTALGAAFAAGLGVGFYSGLDELRSTWGLDRAFEPTMSTSARDQLHATWKKAVGRSFAWL